MSGSMAGPPDGRGEDGKAADDHPAVTGTTPATDPLASASGVPAAAAAEVAAEAKSRLTTLDPLWAGIVKAGTALFATYFLATTFRQPSMHYQLALFIGATVTFIFLLYPARKRSARNRPTIVDGIWIAMTLAPTISFMLTWEAMLLRYGRVTDAEMVFGLLLSLACLEACRRVLGWPLPVLAVLMVGYAYFGPYLPDMVAHRGFGVRRLMGQIYSSNGIYGIVARTFSLYVVIFIVFGAFLQKTKAGDAFVNLALAAVGRSPGGAGKAAVISSGLTGSFLGAGAANITVTGTFTIPLMKRSGFKPHVAGGIETVASIGGHLVPPVMGAAVFLMASFTGIPYARIIAVAAIPAVMLYITLYASVSFYAKRHQLGAVTGIDGGRVPPFLTTIKQDGLLLLPIVVLIVMIFQGFSPFRAAGYATMSTVVFALIYQVAYRRKRIDLRGIVDALSAGTIQTLVVAATAGVMGILLAALFLPGTTLLLSGWVVNLSGGRMFLAILLVILASYVLGMGMTITASYVIIAIVAAPVLVDFGVPVLIAHLAVIWFSQDSSFTPPFALGAWIAAGIADADPQKTAWRSVLIGKPIYIIPILMIYTPMLGLDGFTPLVYFSIGTSMLGLIMLSATAEQYCFTRFRLWETPAFVAAALLLVWPMGFTTGSMGLVVSAVLLGRQYLAARRERAEDPTLPLPDAAASVD